MTPLPTLPTNLSTNNIGTTVSQITTQVVPQFPNIPTIPSVTDAQGVISNALAGPTTQLQQFTAASATILGLIEVAIPEKQISQLIERFRLPNGTVDFGAVNTELNKINETITTTNDKIINAQIPPVSELLSGLIPTIPTLDIPSPAEIKQYINNLIDRRKQLEQEAIMKLQDLEAEKELTPFSSRQEENT